ncbi:hypothetical protein HYH03_003842 [Edaphochlamys debaryana]|uniref:Uncharacterized protein n=1 Tax=Edaphochlamys debaryana TaxID=47281 RepID=A0A836C3V3_9CHLO|nr:hypothetical protein HYH03_003842 [Edaphochlamys debaryana]|eukprot:KAG2498084.1 hypothetical protein HYH03_003842 [Edaphochlamys debaryana]
MLHTGLAQHHVHVGGPGAGPADSALGHGMLRGVDPLAAGQPPAKRLRVIEDSLQHAPRERSMVEELMGWRNTCSQEPSALTSALTGLGVGGSAAAAPTGPTSFAGFLTRPPLQPAAQPQAASGAAAAGLRTFADVASRPAVQEDVKRQDMWGALRAVYTGTTSSLGPRTASQHAWADPSCGAAPAPAAPADGGAAAAAAAGVAGEPSGLEGLAPEDLPVDWALKRKLTFTSSARFACHDKAQQAPARARWSAMQAVVNCNLSSAADEATQFLACQLSWRHPEMPLDSAALAAARALAQSSNAAGAGTGAGPGPRCEGLLSQRMGAWRRALQSLYGTYRGGDCHMFYLVNTAPRNPFAILFAYHGLRGSGQLCAVVSQSSRSLRGRLAATGVPFSMPLEREGAAKGTAAGGGGGGGGGPEAEPGPAAEEEADEDLCDEKGRTAAMAAAASVPGAAVADNSRQSLLLFRGARAVHGLYDFCMNELSYPGMGGRGSALGGGTGEDLHDLPVLLAPAPFEGGAAWRPAIKAVTMSTKLANDALASGLGPSAAAAMAAAADPAADPAGGAVTHVLQVTGLLPPWTVRRMCSLLADVHRHGYVSAFETEPYSIPLNSRVVEAAADGVREAAAAARPIRFAHGGAVAEEELAAWRQPAALPGGRPVKGVACAGAQRRLSVRV